ncbi:hypothetical protein SLS58_007997 [Diplodia intermedia]|uniref:Zn(2)-C6 fungal-type domain-containing protein n=1 Tax=Diplodia intermedia TaxID=856260 RepID=A0ABR3TIP7_9PEZI
MTMSSASRHIACKLCRDRKVRCDGGQPRCQRCLRSGDECVYTLPAKQQRRHGDLQQTVELLEERLSQAEAALSSASTRHSSASASDTPGRSLPPATTPALALDLDALPGAPVLDDFDFNLLDAGAALLSPPPAAELLGDEPWESVQSDLNNIYFRLVDPSFPLVERADCPATPADPLAPQEACALQLALFAHAALRCRSYSHLADGCYESARRTLERVEIETPAQATNVAALQAYVHIALFEFRKGFFTRAVASATRAVWISRLLRLHRLDAPGAAPLPLPEAERCRRAFWAAFMLDMFVRIDADASPRMALDEREISTLLPACLPGEPITLSDAYAMPNSGKLDPHQGLVLSMAIAGQAIELAHHLSREKAPGFPRCDFWIRHDQLNDTIDNARRYGLAHFHASSAGLDPITLSTQALLYASELSLCEAAKCKSRAMSVGASFRSAKRQRWMPAMLGFIDVVIQLNHVDANRLHPFTPWAVYVAMQSCIRQLHQGEVSPPDSVTSTDSSPTPAFSQLLDWIHLLSSTISELQKSTAFAGAFDVDVRKEIESGDDFIHSRVVGLANFPVVARRYGV